MNTSTSLSRRHAIRGAAIAAIAVVALGAAACGTETKADSGSPASRPAPKAQSNLHAPISADSAERRGNADGASGHTGTAPGGHEVYLP
jgi:hypothetical protein